MNNRNNYRKYVNQFKEDLKSKNLNIISNRKLIKCFKCGESKDRFANITLDSSKPNKPDLQKQLNIKEELLRFYLSIMKEDSVGYKQKDALDAILDNSKIVFNSTSVDVSYFKKTKYKIANKSTIILEVFCGKCGNIVHTSYIHKENFIEAFFRKSK